MAWLLATSAGLPIGWALVLGMAGATAGVAYTSLSTLAWSRLGDGLVLTWVVLTCVVLRRVRACSFGWRSTQGLGMSSPFLLPVLLLASVVHVAAGKRVRLARIRVKSG